MKDYTDIIVVVQFSEGTPLTLFYVDKDLAESEHLKLRQGYKELTPP